MVFVRTFQFWVLTLKYFNNIFCINAFINLMWVGESILQRARQSDPTTNCNRMKIAKSFTVVILPFRNFHAVWCASFFAVVACFDCETWTWTSTSPRRIRENWKRLEKSLRPIVRSPEQSIYFQSGYRRHCARHAATLQGDGGEAKKNEHTHTSSKISGKLRGKEKLAVEQKTFLIVLLFLGAHGWCTSWVKVVSTSGGFRR